MDRGAERDARRNEVHRFEIDEREHLFGDRPHRRHGRQQDKPSILGRIPRMLMRCFGDQTFNAEVLRDLEQKSVEVESRLLETTDMLNQERELRASDLAAFDAQAAALREENHATQRFLLDLQAVHQGTVQRLNEVQARADRQAQEATKLRSKVQEAESSSLKWHGKSVELESALHELQDSLVAAQTNHQSELAAAEASLQAAQAQKRQELAQQAAAHRAELDTFLAKDQEKSSQIDDLRVSTHQQDIMISELTEEVGQSKREFKKLSEELQAEKEGRLQLANALTSFKEQAEETQRLQSEETSKLCASLEAAEMQLHEQTSALTASLNQAQEDAKKELQLSEASHKAEMEVLHGAVQEKEDIIQALETTSAQNASQLSLSRANLEVTRKDADTLRQELDKVKQESVRLSASEQGWREQAEHAQTRLTAAIAKREKDLKAAEAQFNLDLAEAAALLHEEKAEWHEELEERDAQHKAELDALHLKHQQEITDLRARLPSAEPSNGRRPANAVSQTADSADPVGLRKDQPSAKEAGDQEAQLQQNLAQDRVDVQQQAPVEVEDNLNDQTASNDSDFTFVDGASAFDTGASSHHQQIDDLSSVELPAVKTGGSHLTGVFKDSEEWQGACAAGSAEGWLISPDQVVREEVIGKGSFGETFRGLFEGETVAIKCVRVSREIEAKIFLRELGALARVRHANLMAFRGAVLNPPNVCWLVVEYLPGGTLADWLYGKQGGGAPRRTIQEKVKMGIGIAKGMTALEATDPPIMHRDLKPTNILIDESGAPKISDFGLCREHLEDEAYAYTGETGSYTYMSPEMMRGEMYGPSTDVYSFAVLFAEIVRQKPPFEEFYLTPVQVAEGVAYQDIRPTLPNNTPSGLRYLIEACWCPEPEGRPEFAVIIGHLMDIQKNLPTKRGLFS